MSVLRCVLRTTAQFIPSPGTLHLSLSKRAHTPCCLGMIIAASIRQYIMTTRNHSTEGNVFTRVDGVQDGVRDSVRDSVPTPPFLPFPGRPPSFFESWKTAFAPSLRFRPRPGPHRFTLLTLISAKLWKGISSFQSRLLMGLELLAAVKSWNYTTEGWR